MKGRTTIFFGFGAGVFLLLMIVFLVPLSLLLEEAFTSPASELQADGSLLQITVQSFALAFLIAAVSIVLGYIPGKVLGTCRRGKFLIFVLMLMPLVLPPYVLQYCWRILYSPTTFLGNYIAAREHLAKTIELFVSSGVLVLWFWPLAALLMSQGWRRIDKNMLQSASLETGSFGRFRYITLPLMAGPIILAFGVCFILCLCEFTTFHLASIRTIGTELAVLYQLTGSTAVVARAAWPVLIAAVVVAGVLSNMLHTKLDTPSEADDLNLEARGWQYAVLIILFVISFAVPVFILLSSIANFDALRQFFKLHLNDAGWTILTCAVAAGLAYLIAGGACLLERMGRQGQKLFTVAAVLIITAMLAPGALVAVALLKTAAVYNFPDWLRKSFLIVSAGLAIRFSAIALIVMILLRTSQQKITVEMARLDGASEFDIFIHIRLPQLWRPFVGIFLLIFMLGASEIAMTGILLPAGVPNFAQFLLNQMHFARDQQVIAACMVLILVFLAAAIIFVLLIRTATLTRSAFLMLILAAIICIGGCKERSLEESRADVLFIFGSSGRGDSEFLRPRAIDIAPDGSIFVADRTGRIQRFAADGKFISSFKMPLFEKGYPTGISFASDGNLYVADTHYNRVAVFTSQGQLIRQWGQYGEEKGNFIYPTDVAFADGKIFVSEYGGNDRISVFDPCGLFLFCFGSPGSSEGQFSRPAALCVDSIRKILYIADSCNHRIAVYDLDGKLLKYFGSAGREAGELSYPYGLALLEDGDLAVCEYGNNRIQIFSPDGKTIAVYGRAGRDKGELVSPWSLVVDGKKRAYVLDSDNNRIQVWQL